MVQVMDDIISRDIPMAFQLLQEMSENVQQVEHVVNKMLVQVKKGEVSTEKGLSFLEMKYHMLLGYLINLSFIVLHKCTGKMVEGDPTIDRLIEIRTVLEKINPIDRKLKYQINKLMKTATSEKNDPTSFHANPANMMSKLEQIEDSDVDSENEGDDSKNKELKTNKEIYVPPKLAAVHYDFDDRNGGNQQFSRERARRQSLGSSMMQELQEEYFDRPVEVLQNDVTRVSLRQQHHHKERYEEEYFTRLPMTKKEHHKARALSTLTTLGDELTGFGAHSAGADSSKIQSSSKRKKGFKKGKSRKKGRFH